MRDDLQLTTLEVACIARPRRATTTPPSRRRRWIVRVAVAATTLCALVLVGRRFLEKHLREQLLPELEQRFGRDVEVGEIQFGLGTATVFGIAVRGPLDDPNASLARVNRAKISVDLRSLILGEVVVEHIALTGVEGHLLRNQDGEDNVSDLLRALTGGDAQTSGAASTSRRLRMDQASLRASDVTIRVNDEVSGSNTTIRSASLTVDKERTMHLSGLDLSAQVPVWNQEAFLAVKAARVRVSREGRIEVSADHVQTGSSDPRLQAVLAKSAAAKVYVERVRGQDGEWELHMMGGFASSERDVVVSELSDESFLLIGTLPAAGGVELRVAGKNLQLGRLGPLLTRYPQLITEDASVSGEWTINATRNEMAVHGEMTMDRLALSHPRLAKEAVQLLSTTVRGRASFDRRRGELRIDDATLVSGEVPYQLSAGLLLPGYQRDDHPQARLAARLSMPEVACQDMLSSLPLQLAPQLQGFELEGRVQGEIDVDIDWADLDLTQLEFDLGMDQCSVIAAPTAMSASRLRGSFDHRVPVPGGWRTYLVGPENPDYVALASVSQNLKRSFLTTEDSAFYRHQGFITQEFRGALVKNLKRGRFAYGASSISMQVVKNVLLSREKTVSRKLQELFLTWYLEQTLSKDRILEIYVNAIEFGPGLYGIKPAARQYFSKHPRSLNPVESAFLSSLLPAPTRRYRQYCGGGVRRSTSAKIERILSHMNKRQRLDEEEYALALETPLAFRGRRSTLCKQSNPSKKGENS